MAKGKNYRKAILGTVEELKLWDKEVHIDALAQDTGIEAVKISACISGMRHEGYPIDIVRREGRKIVSWKFKDQAKWTEKVVANGKAKGEAFKGTNYVTQSQAHNTVREAANTKSRTQLFKEGYSVEEVDKIKPLEPKGYTDEDMDRGRRVLQNWERMPKEVKDKIEALKDAVPEHFGDVQKILVDLLGASPVQDADPTFWAVDQFADGSLMLARKDGTHWKATKL